VSLIHITSWADRISSQVRRKVGCFALYVWKYGWDDSVFHVRWNLSFVYLCSNRDLIRYCLFVVTENSNRDLMRNCPRSSMKMHFEDVPVPPPPVHYPWSSPPPIPTSPSIEHQVCIFIIIYLLLVILWCNSTNVICTCILDPSSYLADAWTRGRVRLCRNPLQ
jgi:hypothetical protein